MSRKRSRTPLAVSAEPDVKHFNEPDVQAVGSSAKWPSPWLRRLVSVTIALHFFGLIVAWSGNAAPSLLQGELQRWLTPVHVSTGQDHIMLPFQLTHSSAMEAPLLIQYRLDGEPNWKVLQLPGLRVPDDWVSDILPADFSLARSRWTNAARLLTWIAVEQPDSEVLPAFLKQSLAYAQKQKHIAEDEKITEVRLFQPHPLTFDEHRTIVNNPQLQNMLGEQLSGTQLYMASVVYRSDGELLLVMQEEARRTAAALTAPPDEPDQANQP